MELTADNLKHIVEILGDRFGDLVAVETIDLATRILEGIQLPPAVLWYDVNDPTKCGVVAARRGSR